MIIWLYRLSKYVDKTHPSILVVYFNWYYVKGENGGKWAFSSFDALFVRKETQSRINSKKKRKRKSDIYEYGAKADYTVRKQFVWYKSWNFVLVDRDLSGSNRNVD